MLGSRFKTAIGSPALRLALIVIVTSWLCIGLNEIADAEDAVPILTHGGGRFIVLSDGRVVGFASPDDWRGELYLDGVRDVKDIAVGGSQFVFKNKENETNYFHFQMVGQLSAMTNSGALLITDAKCGGGDDGTVECEYLPAREVPLKVKAKQISGSSSLLAYVGEDGRLYIHRWRSISQEENAGSFQAMLRDESKINFSPVEIKAYFLQVSVFGDMIAIRDEQKNIYIIGDKEKLYQKFGKYPNDVTANGVSYLTVRTGINIDQIDLGKILYVQEKNGDLYSVGRLSYPEEHSLFSISMHDYEDKYKNLDYRNLTLIDKNVKTVFALPSSTIIAHRDRSVAYTYWALGNFLFGDGEGKPISQETFRAISNTLSMYVDDKSQFYKSNAKYTPELFIRGVNINSADQYSDRIIIVTGNKIYISGWDNIYGPSIPQVHSNCRKNTPLRNTLEIDIPSCLKR